MWLRTAAVPVHTSRSCLDMTAKLGPCHARVLKPQAGVLKTHSRNRVACTPGESGDYYAPPQAQRGRGAAWSSTPTEPPVASIRSRSLPLGGSCHEQRAAVQARGWQAAAPDLSTCSCTGTGMAERAFSSSACSSALAILIGGRTYAEGTTASSRLGQRARWRLASAPDHTSGCPKLRRASASS